MAIGHGWDVHRLVAGRRFLLGGVDIPHPTGPLGHSDGDVLLHAIIDALLGAAGLGDIGRLFPDTDPSIKGIASEAMLATVLGLLRGKWTIVNIDATVITEAPKIAPHRDAIQSRVSTLTACRQVNIKAKTNEGLGYIGAREAIECHAVVELKPA
ncbi:MAG TPA: 2-C-methyl-D-erythritol 2,4-cyclodiphosphate synthase [Planctomycetota bacterium]|nr:2-C-methyl-D-erythritol 2,4-cyclodiphosphate synthase [Planctomycetota bacterium]